MVSVKDPNFKNQHTFDFSLSDETNEYFQELIRIYVQRFQLKCEILQWRYS